MRAEITEEIIIEFNTDDPDMELTVTIGGEDVDAIEGVDGRYYYGISVEAIQEDVNSRACAILESLEDR